MTSVEFNGDGFVVEALVLADAFGLTEDEVREKMRDGLITSRSEKGEGEDAGRWRLTFHHKGRACRFIIDEAGTVLKRTSFPIRAGARGPVARHGGAGVAPPGRGRAS